MVKFLWWLTIVSILLIGLISSSNKASASPDFLDWMHQNGLTKYNQIEDFRPFDNITRWEAAKFVDKFAEIQILDKTYTECDFSDTSWYDSTLIPHIKQACFYGLMKWSNGKYRPNGTITEAEAITVVMRSIYGFFEETANPWWVAYYNRGKDLGLITDEDLREIWETNISREKLWTWFYQAAQLNTDWWFYSTQAWKAQYTTYSPAAFDQAIKDNMQVALFFHAKWCPICHGTRDVITDNIDELPKNVRIFEVDFEKSDDLQAAYNVKWQTTFVFFDKNWDYSETSRSIYPDVLEELLKRFK